MGALIRSRDWSKTPLGPLASWPGTVHQIVMNLIAVTDLSMPGISGFDLARELLALRPTLPVVMITGFARAEDYTAASEAGVSALILKPSTVEQLASELRRFFLERIDLKKGAPA